MIPILDGGYKTSYMAGHLEVDFTTPLGAEDVASIESVKIYKESDSTDMTSTMYSSANSTISGKKAYPWIMGGSASTTPTAYIVHVKIASNSSPAKQYDCFIRIQVVDPWVAS
jgi:hypothetical protein